MEQQEDRERVVEYFVVAAEAPDGRQAEIKFAYPDGDSESTREFCDGVAMFMFPHAFGQDWDKRGLPPPPMHNLFALTDARGEHLYGASLCFYETLLAHEAPPLLSTTSTNSSVSATTTTTTATTSNTNSAESDSNNIVNSPLTANNVGVQYRAKAICLLAKRPFYTQLLRYLEQLFLIGTRQAHVATDAAAAQPSRWSGVERTLCNLFYEVPVPQRGLAVQLTVGAVDIVLARPPLHDFPFEMDAEFMTYAFMMVEPRVMLQLFHHVLLEHRILVVCADSVLVTAIAEALKSLTFPLTWLHVYIPNVPDSLDLSTLLEAPVPFIAGAHTRQLEHVVVPRNVVKLVFTAGKFVLAAPAPAPPATATTDPEAAGIVLPLLPEVSQRLAAKLSTLRLPDFAAQKREFHEKVWDRRIQLQKLCMSTTSCSSSSSADSVLAKPLFLTRPNALYRKVMKLYVDVTAALLRGYPQCIAADGNQTAFDAERFVERKPANERAFYREFVRTALFQSFVAQHNEYMSGALPPDDAAKLQFVLRHLLSDCIDGHNSSSVTTDAAASKTFVAQAPQLPAVPVAARKRSFILPTRLLTGCVGSSVGRKISSSSSSGAAATLEPVNVSIRFPDLDASAFGCPRAVTFPTAAHDATTTSFSTFIHTRSSAARTRRSMASKELGGEWMQQLLKTVPIPAAPFKRRDVLTSTTTAVEFTGAMFKRSRTAERFGKTLGPTMTAVTRSPLGLSTTTASPFYRTMTQRALESTNSLFRTASSTHVAKQPQPQQSQSQQPQQPQDDPVTRAGSIVQSTWLATTHDCTCFTQVAALTDVLAHVLSQHERNSSHASSAYCALIDCLGACGHASEAKAVFDDCLRGSHLVSLATIAQHVHYWMPLSNLVRCYVRNGLVQRAFELLAHVQLDEAQHLDPMRNALVFDAYVLAAEREVVAERIYATFSCGNLGLYLAPRDTGTGAEVVAVDPRTEKASAAAASSYEGVDGDSVDGDNNNNRNSTERSVSTASTAAIAVKEYDVVETINGDVVLQSSLHAVVQCLKHADRPVTVTFLRGLPKLESLLSERTGIDNGAGSSGSSQQQQQQPTFRPRKDLCDRFGVLPQRGIRITTLADCTACNARASLREIQDGWSTSDANDYTTRCAHCSARYVPRLCVTLGALTAFYQPPRPLVTDNESPAPAPVRVEQCEYLSMRVLCKELANVALTLPLTLLSMAELRDLNARIYWNIVVKLLSLACALDFLDLPDATTQQQPALLQLVDDASRSRELIAGRDGDDTPRLCSGELLPNNGAPISQRDDEADRIAPIDALDSDVCALQEQFVHTLRRLDAKRNDATWEQTLAATLAHLEQFARNECATSDVHRDDGNGCEDECDNSDDGDDDGERLSCRTVSLVESSACTEHDIDEVASAAKPRRGGSRRLAPFQRKARVSAIPK